MNILVVDDSKENLKLVSEFLKEKGYQLALALEGYSALKILENNKIDLILLDVMMPGMDGYELCGIIKKQKKYKEIPIIFLTAKNDTQDIVKGFDAGGIDYILKPFKQEELLARVNNQIELNQSRLLIRKQAENLARAKNEIEMSIRYAHLIQKEILPQFEVLDGLFENFVIYQPRDILSGDFYWIMNEENIVNIILADCTGHGVPGALISIMAITLLNQLPHEYFKQGPSAILEYMRKSVKKIFRQVNMDSKIIDGFDMAILSLDRINRKAVFAGANIPLYRILAQSGKLDIVSPENAPIAIHPVERLFSNKEFNFEANDTFYMLTDGLKDLYDESYKQRYTEKRIVNLLEEICGYPFLEQKEMIINNIENWKGNGKPTDDIAIVGIRI